MSARAVRNGRWGIQQKIDGVWVSCTVWMGFARREDAEAHVTHCNDQSTFDHRVYDRHVRDTSLRAEDGCSGEVSAAQEARGAA